MRQVSVIVHLDLADTWAGVPDADLEAAILETVRTGARHAWATGQVTAADVEVIHDPPAPAVVPYPVPAEDLPQRFLTARERCRASGWPV